MESTIRSLSEVIGIIDKLPWRQALYLVGDYPWHADTSCAVLDPNETDDPDEVPDFAKQHGMKYSLNVQTVQDIVANAKQQSPDADITRLIEAFNFYYRRDAFIKF